MFNRFLHAFYCLNLLAPLMSFAFFLAGGDSQQVLPYDAEPDWLRGARRGHHSRSRQQQQQTAGEVHPRE